MSALTSNSKINVFHNSYYSNSMDNNRNSDNNDKNTLYQQTEQQKFMNESSLPQLTRQFKPYQMNNKFASLYQLVDQIGCGGYGFVMSAINRITKQEVAVKFIYKEKLPKPTSPTELIQQEPLEISILKEIHHPTVIDYIDSFEDDTYFYLVMELYGCEWTSVNNELSSSSSASPVTPTNSSVNDHHFSDSLPPSLLLPEQQQQKVRRSSCDLFECIERHTNLSEFQAHKIFKQIVTCINDLSDLGIYHRDIKDENIVVDSNFKVKLIDFGSAIRVPPPLPTSDNNNNNTTTAARDQFTIKKFHGTISFASPEILLGLPYRPEPAEVWSLGILLFTLLYGQVPFYNSNQVISGIWNKPSQPKSSDCMDLLTGILKNNPQKRLTIKQIMQHPWIKNTVYP